MITRIASWISMALLAWEIGTRFPFTTALTLWSVAVVILCAIGASLIAAQPLGVATLSGRVGSHFLQWGWKFTRGRLIFTALVSGLLWILLGSALIGALQFPSAGLLILAWLVDGLLLLYLLGVMLTPHGLGNQTLRHLALPSLTLTAMILVSAGLWIFLGTDSARAWALAAAAGPLLLGAGGYSLFFGTLLLTNRGRRWQ